MERIDRIEVYDFDLGKTIFLYTITIGVTAIVATYLVLWAIFLTW